MKKKVRNLMMLGSAAGIVVYVFIILLISYAFNTGRIVTVPGKLVLLFHNELNAFLIFTLYFMICGAGWACASLIWELDHWSLLKQFLVHFTICIIISFPIAYALYWISHEFIMIVLYFLIFASVYAVVWYCQYIALRKNIKLINKEIGK